MDGPESPENRVGQLVQGSVIELPILPILSTTAGPLHPVAQTLAATLAPHADASLRPAAVGVRTALGLAMVITQTCDLQPSKTLAGRVLAQVAPLVELEGAMLQDALRSTRPNYVAVPWIGETTFADLDQMAAIDRGLLAKASVRAAPDESQRKDLAYHLGRYHSRAALPNNVVDGLRDLKKIATESKHGALRRVLGAIREFRILSEPTYDHPPPYHLTVLVVVDPEWLPDAEPATVRPTGKQLFDTASQMVVEYEEAGVDSHGALVTLWRRLLDQMESRVNANVETRSQGDVSKVTFVPVTALSPDEFYESDVMDFGHLSPQTEPEPPTREA